MTDEQWVWLFINQSIDSDEKLESMCPKCVAEVTSKCKCSRCGEPIDKSESSTNSNFDMDRYNKLANENK